MKVPGVTAGSPTARLAALGITPPAAVGRSADGEGLGGLGPGKR